MDIKDNDKITTNSSNEGMQNERSINQKTLYIFDGKKTGEINFSEIVNSILQYANIADALHHIEKKAEYVVQIPLKYKDAFNNGELFINENSKTGTMWPTLYKKLGSGKREFVSNLPIKEETHLQNNPFDQIANVYSSMCLQRQIGELSERIEKTYRAVERIEQGQKDDRIGKLMAGKKQILLALNQQAEDRARAIEMGQGFLIEAQCQIFETFKRKVESFEPIPSSIILRVAKELQHDGYLRGKDKEFEEIQEYYELYLQATQMIAASYILRDVSQSANQIYEMAQEEMKKVNFANLKIMRYLHHKDQDMLYYHASEYVEIEGEICMEEAQKYDSITVEVTGEKLLEGLANAEKETI